MTAVAVVVKLNWHGTWLGEERGRETQHLLSLFKPGTMLNIFSCVMPLNWAVHLVFEPGLGDLLSPLYFQHSGWDFQLLSLPFSQLNNCVLNSYVHFHNFSKIFMFILMFLFHFS